MGAAPPSPRRASPPPLRGLPPPIRLRKESGLPCEPTDAPVRHANHCRDCFVVAARRGLLAAVLVDVDNVTIFDDDQRAGSRHPQALVSPELLREL